MNPLVLVISLFLFGMLRTGEATPFRVLVIGPLTGSTAPFGVSTQHGIELARQELKNEPLEILYEDDQFKPLAAVTAYQRTFSLQKPNAVIVSGSPSALALAALVAKDEIPMIAIASEPKISQSTPFAVNVWVTPEAEAEVIVRELTRLKIHNVALLTANVNGSLAVAKVLRTRLQGASITIGSDQIIEDQSPDCRTSALNIKKIKDVAAIGLILFPGQLGNCAKQIRGLGISAPFFGAETFESPEDIKNSGDALKGAWYAQAPIPTDTFTGTLNALHGEDSPRVASAAGYDALKMLLQARESGAKSGKEISTYLRTLRNFQGAQGIFSATGTGTFTIPASLKRITDQGTFETLAQK